jgi:CHAT domain-containing protein
MLTASEIESMSIDADLVILSACNTAMGGNNSEEPLSGFARAFFEAGARGVMVSNWYINPTSTGELLLAFAKEIRRDPRQPFSFALQAAMISQSKRNSDPRDWAIFTYIGK